MKRETVKNNIDILERQIVSEETSQKYNTQKQMRILEMQYECDSIQYFKRRLI